MGPRTSTSSTRDVPLEHIDPVTAHRDAEIAANAAYNRSRTQSQVPECSTYDPVPRNATNNQESNREIRRSQSIRFVGPSSTTTPAPSGSTMSRKQPSFSITPRQIPVRGVETMPKAPSGSSRFGKENAARPQSSLDPSVAMKENIQPGSSSIRGPKSMTFLRDHARVQQLPNQGQSPSTGVSPESYRRTTSSKKTSVFRSWNRREGKVAQRAAGSSSSLRPLDIGPPAQPLTEKSINQIGPGSSSVKDYGLKEKARQVSQNLKTRLMTLFKNKPDSSPAQIPDQHVHSTRAHGDLPSTVDEPVAESLHAPVSEAASLFSELDEDLRHMSWNSKILPQIPVVHDISTEGIIPKPPVSPGSSSNVGKATSPENPKDHDVGGGSPAGDLTSSVHHGTLTRDWKRLSVIDESGAYVPSSTRQSTLSRSRLEKPLPPIPLHDNGDPTVAARQRALKVKEKYHDILRKKSFDGFNIADVVPPRSSSLSPPLESDNDHTPRAGRFAFRDDDSSRQSTPTPATSSRPRTLAAVQPNNLQETAPHNVSRFHEMVISGSNGKTSVFRPVAAISPRYLDPHPTVADRPSTFFGSPTTHIFRSQSPYRAELRARMEFESKGKGKEPAVRGPSPLTLSESLNDVRPGTSHSDGVPYSESIYSTANSSRYGTPAPQASIDSLILPQPVGTTASNEFGAGSSQQGTRDDFQLAPSSSNVSVTQVDENGRPRRNTLDLAESFPVPPTSLGNATIESSTAYVTSFRAGRPRHRISSSCSSFDWKTWLSADVAKFDSPPKLRLSPVPASPSEKTTMGLSREVNVPRRMSKDSFLKAITVRDDQFCINEDVCNATPQRSKSQHEARTTRPLEVASSPPRLEPATNPVLSPRPLNIIKPLNPTHSPRYKGKENKRPLSPPAFKFPAQPPPVPERSPLRAAASVSSLRSKYEVGCQASAGSVKSSLHLVRSDSGTPGQPPSTTAPSHRVAGVDAAGTAGSARSSGRGGFFGFRRRMKGSNNSAAGSGGNGSEPRPSLPQRWFHGHGRKTAERLESSSVAYGREALGDVSITSTPGSMHMMEAAERQFGKYASTGDTSIQEGFGLSITGASSNPDASASEESLGLRPRTTSSSANTGKLLLPLHHGPEQLRHSGTTASLPFIAEAGLPRSTATDLVESGPATSGEAVAGTETATQGPRGEAKGKGVQAPSRVLYTYTPRGDYVYTTTPVPNNSASLSANPFRIGAVSQGTSANPVRVPSGQPNNPLMPTNVAPRALVASPTHGAAARSGPPVSMQSFRPPTPSLSEVPTTTPRPPTPRPPTPLPAPSPVFLPRNNMARAPRVGSSGGAVRFTESPGHVRIISADVASPETLTADASNQTPPHPTRPAPLPPPSPIPASSSFPGFVGPEGSPHSDSLSSQYNAYPISSSGSLNWSSTPEHEQRNGAGGLRQKRQYIALARPPSFGRLSPGTSQRRTARRGPAGSSSSTVPQCPESGLGPGDSGSGLSGSSSLHFQRVAQHHPRGLGYVHGYTHRLALGPITDQPATSQTKHHAGPSSVGAVPSDEEERAVREYHLARRQRMIARNASRASSAGGKNGSRRRSSVMHSAGGGPPSADARRRKKLSTRKRRSVLSTSTSSSDPYT